MTDGATGLEARRAATARRLTVAARTATAANGLSGFTIEDICAEAGVSRRTFFNYFASKENAVLGLHLLTDESDLEEAFVAGDGDLIDDLTELFVARGERMPFDADDLVALRAAFDREPRLTAHLITIIGDRERDDQQLVRRRVGPDVDPLVAETLVHQAGALVRPALGDVLEGREPDLRTAFHRRLAIARRLFQSRPGETP